jgi:hypothetical protein
MAQHQPVLKIEEASLSTYYLFLLHLADLNLKVSRANYKETLFQKIEVLWTRGADLKV